MRYIIMMAAWLAVIGAGAWWQLRYEQTPGGASVTPAIYPENGPITPRPGRSVVIMALHPRCPCSRASLAELEQLASRAHGELDLVVLVCAPVEAGEDWTGSANCAMARAIPGVQLVPDPGGRTAAVLGMKTSGHVVAYDARRRLVFSGGITPARGQTGPNPGLAALMAIADNQKDNEGRAKRVAGSPAAPTVTAVFGCELVAPDCCDAGSGGENP